MSIIRNNIAKARQEAGLSIIAAVNKIEQSLVKINISPTGRC